MGRPKILIKRVYEDPADGDGLRVLVDRLWPRGLSKAQAHIDLWAKEVAPSPDLRTWWDHDRHRLITVVHDHDRVTLLYAAKDEHVNHARVLQDYLRRKS